MKRLFFFCLALQMVVVPRILACTNLIVGKNASADGSVIVSYCFDEYAFFGRLARFPAAEHPEGSMREIHEIVTGKYLGVIPEAPRTYLVTGNMNEYQLTIAETTFVGRKELRDSTGIMDYGSLIDIGLQRARTAREAITVITDLVTRYGYYSTGESFTIADPDEAWILEMVGKGPGSGGAVWVAMRVPDDCIAAHANQARIHQFPLNDPENCIYAPDVITFARQQGYFSGEDMDFSFSTAYNPLTHANRRSCEGRVWSYYNRFTDYGEEFLPYILDQSDTPLPLYVKPNRKVSVREVQNMMRDHFEGTILDPSQTYGAGPYHSPYRLYPRTFTYKGKKYFHERSISIKHSAFVFVAQMRNFLPREVGGVLWYGQDDATTTVFTPVYCSIASVPSCYDPQGADYLNFSWESAFWVYNFVANLVYDRYDLLMPDLVKTRLTLEDGFERSQPRIEQTALTLLSQDRQQGIDFLTNYTAMMASSSVEAWKKLGTFLIVKFNDGVVVKEQDGVFLRNEHGLPQGVSKPGYGEDFLDEFVERTAGWNSEP